MRWKAFLRKIKLGLCSYDVDRKTKKSLSQNIKYALSFKPLRDRLTFPSNKFFLADISGFYKLLKSDGQKAIDFLRAHCEIFEPVSIKLTYEKLHQETTLASNDPFHQVYVPGITYCLNPFTFNIWLDYNQPIKVLGSILVHEISHIYQGVKNIKFSTSSGSELKFNEQMTDLLTIVLGLGKVMQKGNRYHTSKGIIEHWSTVGYLKPEYMNYAQDFMLYLYWDHREKIINSVKKV